MTTGASAPPPRGAGDLHVLWTKAPDLAGRRRALRGAIERLLAGLGWTSEWCGCGRRKCFRSLDDTPAPPVSISYSGPVALALVGGDGGSVGVDVEAYAPRRAARYGRIVSTVLGRDCPEPAAAFVRAEAWAKASGCGLLRAPRYFLDASETPGWRNDGCFVHDVDLSPWLPHGLLAEWRLHAAICAARGAPATPRIHALPV